MHFFLTGQWKYLTEKYIVESGVQDQHRTSSRDSISTVAPYVEHCPGAIGSVLGSFDLVNKRCIYDLNLVVVVFSLRVCTESVAPNLGYLSYVRPLRSRKTKLTLVTSYHMTSPLFSSIFSKR